MKIEDGKIVTMDYCLTDTEGRELDRSEEGKPLVYMHGKGQLVPGLETHLNGQLAKATLTKVKVESEDAYGDVRADLILKVARTQFPENEEVAQGMQFWAETPEGDKHPFTVVEVGSEEIEIDGNHPLAGETLFFDIEIHDVREATKEELEHGHAHGPGGHHH